jgi:hypothetical protein
VCAKTHTGNDPDNDPEEGVPLPGFCGFNAWDSPPTTVQRHSHGTE